MAKSHVVLAPTGFCLKCMANLLGGLPNWTPPTDGTDIPMCPDHYEQLLDAIAKHKAKRHA